jgi:hypothetical protein
MMFFSLCYTVVQWGRGHGEMDGKEKILEKGSILRDCY